MKKINFEQESRDKLLQGVEKMYKAVATTLGPKGRNVAISRPWGIPIVVHDGVTVAREVEDDDEWVNMGVQLLKEAAQKTNLEAGDGTTTSTLLAYHIVDKGMKLINEGKVNAMILREEMESALQVLLEELKNIKTDINSKEDVKRVATISSADEQIGQLVADAMDKVGKEGLVTVEEGGSVAHEVEYTEGLEFDEGMSSFWFTTNADRQEAVIADCAVVILGKKVTAGIEFAAIFEATAQKNKNMVFIGEIAGDALQIMIHNKRRGIVACLAVEPPYHGDRRQAALDDLAVITGATIVTDELGLPADQFALQFDANWIGSAKNVISTAKTTTIIGGGGTKESIEERVKQLRSQLEKELSIFEKEHLEERIAKLTTGAGVIRVAARTEIDMREKVERVKDAVGAAKAALQEGIVPGGGVAFLQLAKSLDKLDTVGAKLLAEVLKEPIIKLLINAGKGQAEIEKIVSEVQAKSGNIGYDINSDSILDLIDKGVIDPSKVIRLSLENGVSVGGSILTTDCLIADKREEPKVEQNV